MFKPFQKGGKRKSKKLKGGSDILSTFRSWSTASDAGKNLGLFAKKTKQYYPTSKETVGKTRMFKPFQKGGKRK